MLRKLLPLFVMTALSASVWAEEHIAVAAASDLQFALREVATRFHEQTGNTVELSFGSSGNFYSQLQNGAPFDVFFSADLDYPKKLEASGLIEPGSTYQYATGKIVVWVARESKLDLSRGLAALLDARVRKIAIANPEHAPYGKAAVAAMRSAGVYDKIQGKLVYGENASQAAQFVATGNTEAGIIALSLALAPAMKEQGRYVEVPASSYPLLQQACVVLKASTKKKTSLAFIEFLKKPEMVELLRSHGFSTSAP